MIMPELESVEVVTDHNGETTIQKFYARSGVYEHTFDALTIEALRNHFQQERDQELGRWRDPENPDWVVYPGEIPAVVWAANEKTGSRDAWSRISVEKLKVFIKSADVARRYFAAHPEPEPRPWEAARPDEIWVLTINNNREEVFRCGGGGLYQLKTGNPIGSLLCGSNKITAGRRIWPEEEAGK